MLICLVFEYFNMATDDHLPMPIDLSRKKVIKDEIKLQSVIQDIRNTCHSFEDLHKLSTIARNILRSIKSGIEEVELLCEEEDIRSSVEDIIQRHRDNYASLQTALRKANLAAEEQLLVVHKEALLYGKTDSGTATKRLRGKEESAKTAAKITEGLLRSARLMESQVQHHEETTRKLEESSQDIKKTQDEYKGLTGVIGTSKKLISKYSRRELTDTILIFFGLILFFSTVLYIVLKRM